MFHRYHQPSRQRGETCWRFSSLVFAGLLACILVTVPRPDAVMAADTPSTIPPTVLKVLEETGALDDSAQMASTSDDFENLPFLADDEYFRAIVVKVRAAGMHDVGGYSQPYQDISVRIESGAERGKELDFRHGAIATLREDQLVEEGDSVVLIKLHQYEGDPVYAIADRYRLPSLALVVGIFFLLTIAWGRWRGVGAIVGLLVSVLILVHFVVPRILDGGNPLVIATVGGLVISIVSMYLAHGVNRRATIALVSTVASLVLAVVFSWLFVWMTKLTGNGSEEAFLLQSGSTSFLDTRGLLLGAMIIGALGVLEDITIGQAAAVDEIHQANPTFRFRELYRRGTSVGREHIAALVNTLALAYAGASFPLFLLFYTQSTVPAWVTLNSELIVEELVRTIAGSALLVVAVPMTTALTAFLWTRDKKRGR